MAVQSRDLEQDRAWTPLCLSRCHWQSCFRPSYVQQAGDILAVSQDQASNSIRCLLGFASPGASHNWTKRKNAFALRRWCCFRSEGISTRELCSRRQLQNPTSDVKAKAQSQNKRRNTPAHRRAATELSIDENPQMKSSQDACP